MNWERIFYELVMAEDEEAVTQVLDRQGLLREADWRPLDDRENNFGSIGNQQSDATGAMVEKLINAIDAVLMREAFKRNIDPESSDAPRNMREAVERFFAVRDGRLENITPSERTRLAEKIAVVATGAKGQPSYLIIDDGEGQTPNSFPRTFLSLSRSNKMRIPFVQGRFNAGGTGVLQFCGKKNYQLIASKRAPEATTEGWDSTSGLWGFTLIGRLLPAGGRRNSMYVYLAPGGEIPSFKGSAIRVIPEQSPGSKQPEPYKGELKSGTVVKLYNYDWKGRSLATTEARFELERLLHSPCLPFRVIETRKGYAANYYATTVAGVWVRIRGLEEEESNQVEEGFPSYAEVDIPGVGTLPYGVVVFREEVTTRKGTRQVRSRRVPSGVVFTLNGQVHGSLPRDFVSREMKFAYIAPYTLVSVDCNGMYEQVREDFIMASRDRVRRNETYEAIAETIRSQLQEHPGLRELNARRRAKRIEEALQNETQSQEAFQDLIKSDPALAALFGAGEHLATSVGPTNEPIRYLGRRFPSFFRIAKEPSSGLVKSCPSNWKCRVEFETDAVNEYFDRPDSPGSFATTPAGVLASRTLWHGQCISYVRPPIGAQPGDEIAVEVRVTDDEREMLGSAFTSQFGLRVEAPREHQAGGESTRQLRDRNGSQSSAPRLAIPNIYEVREDQWEEADFMMGPSDAIRIKSVGDEDGYDFYVNMDNQYLINEIRRNRVEDPRILEYWFKMGLSLTASSMLELPAFKHRQFAQPDNEAIENITAGLARVIVPIVRRLREGPDAAQPPLPLAASE